MSGRRPPVRPGTPGPAEASSAQSSRWRAPLRARLRAAARDDAGFGLLEIIVALFILALVLSSVAYGLTQQMAMTMESRNREVAASLAAGVLDRARAVTDFATLDGAEWTETVSGQAYTILQTVTPYLITGSGSPCDGTSSAAIAYKRVSVRVTWENMGTAQPVRNDTLITPGSAPYDPTKGNIGVRVRDADADGVEGVQVTVTRTGFSASTFTDESGCAFFDAINVATYSVALNEPGFVDWQGVTNPTKSASAIAGQTAGVSFDYDRAATIVLTLPDGGYPLPSTAFPAWAGNAALTPGGIKQFTGSGVTRTLGSLFPFPSGYTTWAGPCEDSNPGDSFPATNVTAGSTVAASLPMPTIKVTVTSTTNGAPVAGAIVTVAHVSNGADDLCPSTGTPAYSLLPTDALGEVRASLPWGTWRVTATTPGASQVQATLDPPDVAEVAVGVTVP